MKGVIILVLSLFICHSLALNVTDTAHFIGGFIDGLALETSGNITACVIDYNATLEEFETGFKLFDEGLRDLNVKKVEQGLNDIGAGIAEVGGVLNICGLSQEAAEIINIGKQIAEGDLLTVVLKISIDIFFHEKTLKEDLSNASSAWKSGDYESSGKYIGEVVAIILAGSK